MFIDQYSYNLDAEPKRSDLEAISQKGDESFSAYVGRWRAVAAQMRNKLDEEKQINMVAQLAHSSIAGYLMSQTHATFQSSKRRLGLKAYLIIMKRGKGPSLCYSEQLRVASGEDKTLERSIRRSVRYSGCPAAWRRLF
jgi:hypothetical protein